MHNKFPKDTSNYKLIVSDFDGTLAGSEHIVTPEVVKAVKMWIDSGRHFTIATGRQYLMIDDECLKMNLIDPLVVRGGAEVTDPRSGKVLQSEFIDRNDVETMLIEIEQSGLFKTSIEIDDTIYSDFNIAVPFPKITFKSLEDFEIKSVPKIHLKPKNEESNEADEFVRAMVFGRANVHSFATHNSKFGKGWDITSTKATKLHGIVKVLEYLDLKKENLVGVGDSYNDFPLLEAASLKVAMSNANSELKEIADFIVPSNEEDGVAFLIERLLSHKGTR